jgi:hypothetical protein
MIPIQNEYLLGKGKVSLCERDANGAVSKAIYTGNAPEFKLSMTNEKITHKESLSGLNRQDREIVTAIGMEFSLTLESISKENIALLTWGTNIAIASAATQSHFFPVGIVDDEIHVIPNGFNITVPVVKDSAGSPATVPDTKYDLDADFGTIQFLDVATYTQPFELEYTRGAAESVPFFGASRPTRFIRFEGQNLGNPGLSYSEKFIVEIYLAAFEPVADFGFLSDEFAKFELKGSAMLDETRDSNSALGGYGRMIKLPAGV